MNQIVAKVNEMRGRAAARKQSPAKPQQQLGFWSERVRGLPNALARSALFTASGKTELRAQYTRHEVVSVKGITVYYTGEELRQDDQDVFLQAVHLTRLFPLGNQIEVSGHALLTALGWGRSKPNYERLKRTIARLVEGTIWVSFDDGRTGYTGRLIDKLKWRDDSETGERVRWKLFLDQDIVALFGENMFSLIDWEQRLSLSSLAKWLHSFYFTHREPVAYKVETIHKLCGSKAKHLAKFRYKLRESLDELVAIGFFSEARIDPHTDAVIVTRTARAALPE
ncbi:plasmid replication initiator TrfA [Burkholderia sp. Ac-20349]|uniref:plasmid replication initiator TrfA n=1 Tax=Burkholderia sp. Ac-20349 TaxID=2703893 RepID=UPI00197BE48F|nr:plasmid replication initiator TrfA [Burkholderia sp. Ac-20349]MBN3839257.1 TrfA family protein [Burkholderia sp. Ac-20349]